MTTINLSNADKQKTKQLILYQSLKYGGAGEQEPEEELEQEPEEELEEGDRIEMLIDARLDMIYNCIYMIPRIHDEYAKLKPFLRYDQSLRNLFDNIPERIRQLEYIYKDTNIKNRNIDNIKNNWFSIVDEKVMSKKKPYEDIFNDAIKIVIELNNFLDIIGYIQIRYDEILITESFKNHIYATVNNDSKKEIVVLFNTDFSLLDDVNELMQNNLMTNTILKIENEQLTVDRKLFIYNQLPEYKNIITYNNKVSDKYNSYNVIYKKLIESLPENYIKNSIYDYYSPKEKLYHEYINKLDQVNILQLKELQHFALLPKYKFPKDIQKIYYLFITYFKNNKFSGFNTLDFYIIFDDAKLIQQKYPTYQKYSTVLEWITFNNQINNDYQYYNDNKTFHNIDKNILNTSKKSPPTISNIWSGYDTLILYNKFNIESDQPLEMKHYFKTDFLNFTLINDKEYGPEAYRYILKTSKPTDFKDYNKQLHPLIGDNGILNDKDYDDIYGFHYGLDSSIWYRKKIWSPDRTTYLKDEPLYLLYVGDCSKHPVVLYAQNYVNDKTIPLDFKNRYLFLTEKGYDYEPHLLMDDTLKDYYNNYLDILDTNNPIHILENNYIEKSNYDYTSKKLSNVLDIKKLENPENLNSLLNYNLDISSNKYASIMIKLLFSSKIFNLLLSQKQMLIQFILRHMTDNKYSILTHYYNFDYKKTLVYQLSELYNKILEQNNKDPNKMYLVNDEIINNIYDSFKVILDLYFQDKYNYVNVLLTSKYDNLEKLCKKLSLDVSNYSAVSGDELKHKLILDVLHPSDMNIIDTIINSPISLSEKINKIEEETKIINHYNKKYKDAKLESINNINKFIKYFLKIISYEMAININMNNIDDTKLSVKELTNYYLNNGYSIFRDLFTYHTIKDKKLNSHIISNSFSELSGELYSLPEILFINHTTNEKLPNKIRLLDKSNNTYYNYTLISCIINDSDDIYNVSITNDHFKYQISSKHTNNIKYFYSDYLSNDIFKSFSISNTAYFNCIVYQKQIIYMNNNIYSDKNIQKYSINNDNIEGYNNYLRELHKRHNQYKKYLCSKYIKKQYYISFIDYTILNNIDIDIMNFRKEYFKFISPDRKDDIEKYFNQVNIMNTNVKTICDLESKVCGDVIQFDKYIDGRNKGKSILQDLDTKLDNFIKTLYEF